MTVNPQLAAWFAGGNSQRGRRDNDFYSTPSEAVHALFQYEDAHIPAAIWEPCCGIGAIASVAQMYGRQVYASDLIARGYGQPGVDFLQVGMPVGVESIITNMPFNLADEMIAHAQRIGVGYMALFFKAQFWHAAKRSELFETFRPARIYALTWRPDFSGEGRPTMDCIWVIWDGHTERTDYLLMKRP